MCFRTVSGFVQKIPMFEERKDQKDLQVKKFGFQFTVYLGFELGR